MSDLLSSFWGKGEKKSVGGDSLERSESESPPTSPAAEGAPPVGDVDAEQTAAESPPLEPASHMEVKVPQSVDDEPARPADSMTDETSPISRSVESEFMEEDWDEPYQAIRADQDETLDDPSLEGDEPAPMPPNLKARRRGTLSKRPSVKARPVKIVERSF